MDSNITTKSKNLIENTNGNICNHCLGRKFSDIEDNLENFERGEKIRKSLDKNNNESSKDKDITCEICENIFQKIDILKKKGVLLKKVEDKIKYLNLEYETFLIGSKVSKDIIKKDEEIDNLILNDILKKNEDNDSLTSNREIENLKKDINRNMGQYLEKHLQKEVDFENPDIVIIVDLRKIKNNEDIDLDSIKIRIQINPIFIEGRYLKLVRGIPQTKWPCRKCKGKGCESCDFTGKMYQESVEELISNIVLEKMRGYESKFHGAGREDIDVKMLGTGRPFVLEIKEPKKRDIDLNKIAEEVNNESQGKTKYNDLKFVEKNRKSEIKVSSPDTYKTYQALVECDEEIAEESLTKLQSLKIIQQQTPLRVSHRRADKIRTKEVKELNVKIIDPKSFEMIIKTQGGLYIKELISGDETRTTPNVSEILGVKAICKQLDVIEVGSEK